MERKIYKMECRTERFSPTEDAKTKGDLTDSNKTTTTVGCKLTYRAAWESTSIKEFKASGYLLMVWKL